MTPSLVLLLGALACFGSLFSLGANDVANSIGVAHGCGALSMPAAIATAALLNVAGALLAGDRVTTAMTASLVPSLAAEPASPRTAIAYLCSLLASIVVIAVGTRLALPLSSTHAVTGALLAAAATVHGVAALDPTFAYEVAAAWLASPALGAALCILTRVAIATAATSYRAYQTIIPALCAGAACAALALVTLAGPPALAQILAPSPSRFAVELAVLFAAVALFSARQVRAQPPALQPQPTLPHPTYGSASTIPREPTFRMNENAPVFKALLVSAVPAIAFAHGSNDVSNGVGPFYGIVTYYLAVNPAVPASPSTILRITLAVGGLAIAAGIALAGRRVMATVGGGGICTRPWTFAQAFAAQSAAAVAVIIASVLGVPVSTSHCVVGAVMGAAVPLGKQKETAETVGDSEASASYFNWRMIGHIAIGAVATPILSGALASLMVSIGMIFV